jgi:iron complex transport system permease protein
MTMVMTTTVSGVHSSYARDVKRRLFAVTGCAVGLALLVMLDLTSGPSGMPLADLWQALIAGPYGQDRTAATILWQLRMPQTVLGTLVGMCLGLAGLQMQTILANPLASPFTLGFSAAPAFLITPICAFLMTLLACGLVYSIAILRGSRPEILVLAGIAVLFFFQSMQSLMQFLASPEVLQQIVFWLFGSLLKATWISVLVVLVILVACLPLLMRCAWQLTTLRLGDANAASLGMDVDAFRRRSFVLVAVLTAAAVSFVGTIGFVGLIAPHAARAVVGEDHRFSLPVSAMTGAIILIGASVFGKIISPAAVIPVGIITAVAGVPILFAVIARRGRGDISWGKD